MFAAHLEIQSVDIGIVKIKGLECNMFICMNEEGETFAEVSLLDQ